MGLQSFAIKLAGALTVSVTGVPLAGDLMESLLGDLAAAQDEQANQLRELERKIDRLLDGPLHTANMYIREAAVPGQPSALVVDKLRAAAAELRRAAPLKEGGSMGRASVLIQLACVLALLGDLGSRVPADDAIRQARAYMQATVDPNERSQEWRWLTKVPARLPTRDLLGLPFRPDAPYLRRMWYAGIEDAAVAMGAGDEDAKRASRVRAWANEPGRSWLSSPPFDDHIAEWFKVRTRPR
jgi:hypothetical protein